MSATSNSSSRVPVVCAAILAGGLSSRMGREKALLEIDGQPLIARTADFLRPIFPRIIVVTPKPEVAHAARLPAIADIFPGCGPLGGFHAALSYYGAPTFCVACDLPFLNRELIESLRQNFVGDALVPLSENGPEPLHAIYGQACLPIFENRLSAGGKIPSMRRILAELDAHFVSETFGADFSNWNSPGDVAKL